MFFLPSKFTGQILTHSTVLKTKILLQMRDRSFALEISGKPLGAAATRDVAAKGQPKASDNCMVASESWRK